MATIAPDPCARDQPEAGCGVTARKGAVVPALRAGFVRWHVMRGSPEVCDLLRAWATPMILEQGMRNEAGTHSERECEEGDAATPGMVPFRRWQPRIDEAAK